MGNILIIDDDEQVLRSLSDVVETLGHRVRTAACGSDGLDLFAREEFDCVITDLAMPDIDGLGVLRHVKGRRPKTGVLIITGNSTVELLVASVNMGADAYVTKPFKIREIDDQLQRLVSRGEEPTDTFPQPLPSTVHRTLAQRIPLGWVLLGGSVLALAVHIASR